MGEMIAVSAPDALKAETPSASDVVNAYLATPEPRKAKGRGVVVLQEYFGLVPHIKDVADRFAAQGYTALAPDLYHGRSTSAPDEAAKLLMAMDLARTERDLAGSVEHLRALTGRKAGIVGFCVGGALSLFAACENGERIGACVVYYGGNRKVTYAIDRLQAPVLGHWAEDDAFANASRDAVEAEMRRFGKAYEFHTYPGTRHAFFNDERPNHDPAAAALSWTRTLAFFDRTL
jgi:carboxymethylenebutenolidase